jgi:hypothetical protein
MLARVRACRRFQPRLPAAVFIDEREDPVCLRRLAQSNSDRLLLAQVGLRQLTLLASEVLIGAGRQALIVAVEMVDDDGVVKKEAGRAGTPDETQASQQRYREAAFHGAAIRFSAGISAAKGQNEVNEANRHYSTQPAFSFLGYLLRRTALTEPYRSPPCCGIVRGVLHHSKSETPDERSIFARRQTRVIERITLVFTHSLTVLRPRVEHQYRAGGSMVGEDREHSPLVIKGGLNTVPENPRFGTAGPCVGKQIMGKQIVYQSKAGFRGTDVVVYESASDKGERSLMTVTIEVR